MALKIEFGMTVLPLGFKDAVETLEAIRDAYPKAAADAINKGLIEGRKAAVTLITERYNVTARDSDFQLNKAHWSNLSGFMTARGHMLPVSKFNITVKNTAKGHRQVVSVTIIRGHKKIIKGAFKLPDGRVMQRRTDTRFPIHPVMTIGIPQMVTHASIRDEVREVVSSETQKQLTLNVNKVLAAQQEKSARVRRIARTPIARREIT